MMGRLQKNVEKFSYELVISHLILASNQNKIKELYAL